MNLAIGATDALGMASAHDAVLFRNACRRRNRLFSNRRNHNFLFRSSGSCSCGCSSSSSYSPLVKSLIETTASYDKNIHSTAETDAVGAAEDAAEAIGAAEAVPLAASSAAAPTPTKLLSPRAF